MTETCDPYGATDSACLALAGISGGCFTVFPSACLAYCEALNKRSVIMNNLSFDVIDALNERTTNILADSYEQVAAYGLDADEVRDAVVKYLLGDQILPVDPALHPKP